MREQHITYEYHNMENISLPFIFHRDTVNASRVWSFNWHENIELLLIQEGEGFVMCDMVAHPVRPGELFVVAANRLHATNAKTSAMTYHCLIIDRSFCLDNGIDTSGLTFEEVVRDPECTRLYHRVIEEYHAQNSFSHAGIRSAVLALLLHLCRSHLTEQPPVPVSTSRALENIKLAIGYIQANYSKPLTLDAIAREIGLSKYHLSREFKRVTGATVITYVNQVRCDRARRMLEKGELSVSQVCAQVGFDNLSYFSKTFRRFTGKLPSQVQKISYTP